MLLIILTSYAISLSFRGVNSDNGAVNSSTEMSYLTVYSVNTRADGSVTKELRGENTHFKSTFKEVRNSSIVQHRRQLVTTTLPTVRTTSKLQLVSRVLTGVSAGFGLVLAAIGTAMLVITVVFVTLHIQRTKQSNMRVAPTDSNQLKQCEE